MEGSVVKCVVTRWLDVSDFGGYMDKKRMKRLLRVATWLLVLGGVLVAASPLFIDMWSSYQAVNRISEIESTYDSMSNEDRIYAMQQAHAYNEQLAGGKPSIEANEIWSYDDQLTYHDEPSTMMSWIEIPKIGVRLAVYHHTTEAVLMAGVGHIDTTSLPVGGEGTNCVVSGHSGMDSMRMFDDIRALDVGDTFVFWSLKEPFAYKVIEIHDMVEPTDSTCLEPRKGKDLATLVTCTPYNVNTHRLIIVGERCEYVPEETTAVVTYNSRYIGPLALAGGAIVVFVILGIVFRIRKKKKVSV